MVVEDVVAAEYKQKYAEDPPGVDLVVSSLSEFQQYAVWMSDSHWDRYDFTHARALVDRTGAIQQLIDAKGGIPAEHRDAFIRRQLGGFVNALYRSVKAFRHQRSTMGFRLEAAMGIPYLLDALFALHGRATPFPDYLERELRDRPLEQFPWSAERLTQAILRILTDGDVETQQECARAVESVFRKEGFGDVFDGWEEKWEWMTQAP
jgi:hypothetical protein